MASIREVARLARVAPSTVSRALNGSGYVAEETKEKIREAVDELDYVPNQWIRNLYQQKSWRLRSCILTFRHCGVFWSWS